MTQKLEGTLQLDGLLEGKINALPDGPNRLAEWVKFAASLGLPFTLEIDGASFSLLAGRQTLRVADLGGEPTETLVNALNQLVKAFPDTQRQEIYSTIRSTEYRPKLEVQTLYAMGPEGKIQPQQRSQAAETTPPPRPMSGKEKVRMAALGLLAVLVVLAISSIFIDYRTLLGDLRDRIMPYNAEAIAVEAGPFENYFSVENRRRGQGPSLLIDLKRSDDFPKTDEDLNRLYTQAGSSLPNRLAVESMASGYVRCEYYDKDGKYIGFTTERIGQLKQDDTTTLRLPLPADRRPAKVVITY